MSVPAAARLRAVLDEARRRTPLPPGALQVGVGLGVQGAAAYVYLVVASRSLGPERYSPLSALWALVFVAAPGLFLPLEQEVGRALAARRVGGAGGRPVLIRAGSLGLGLALFLLGAAAVARGPMVDRLFDGQQLLFIGFIVAVISYAVYYLARGLLAGSGRFPQYSALVIVESAVRVAFTFVLVGVGTRSAGIYSLAIGMPCVAGVLMVALRQRDLARPGPQAAWGELGTALALLLAGSLFAQALVNIAPLAVKVLSTDDPGAAGRFLDGLIIARLPLFFFQAVQASLLPKLASEVAAGRLDEFRRLLLRLVLLLLIVTGLSAAVMLAIGPAVVRLLFGSGFALGRVDLAILATGSELTMVALALAQGCIALRRYGRAAAGWVMGVVVVGLGLAIIPGIDTRAEVAFMLGVAGATFALGVGLLTALRSSAAALTGPAS